MAAPVAGRASGAEAHRPAAYKASVINPFPVVREEAAICLKPELGSADKGTMAEQMFAPAEALSFQLDLLYLCANTFPSGPKVAEEAKKIQMIAQKLPHPSSAGPQ